MRTPGRMALALAPAGLVMLLGVGLARSATTGPAPVVITWSDAQGFGPVTAAPSPGQGVTWFNSGSNPLHISRTAAPTVAITVAAGASSSPLVLAASPGTLAYGGDSRVLLSGAVHSGAIVVPPSPSPSPSPTAARTTAAARTTPAPRRSRTPSPVRSVALLLPSALADATASPSPDGSPLPALEPIPLESAPPISAQPPQVAAAPPVEDSPSPSPSPSEVAIAAVGTGTPGVAGESVPDRRLGLPIAVGLVLALGVGSAVGRVVRAGRCRP